MRYYIIFGITFILLLIILFYTPNDKYLGVYENIVNINLEDLKVSDEGYKWLYQKDDSINVNIINNSSWKLSFSKDGKFKITYYYTQNENIEDAKYIIYYEFERNKNKIYWISGKAKGLLDFPNPY